MWLVHLILVAAWACWLGSQWLPAFAHPDNPVALSGFDCLRLTIMHPWAFPLFGIANFWLMLSPVYARLVARRCPGWFAALGAGWTMAAVGAAVFVVEKPQVGLIAWAFGLCLFASWLALCWLASRRVDPAAAR